MRALILIGWKKSDSGLVPENLYTGLDGVLLNKAHAEAMAKKEYVYIGKVSNPSVTPMPIDPTPSVATTPKFERPKPVVHWQPDGPLEKLQKEALKKRQAALKAPKLVNGKLEQEEVKLPPGPTFEEFVGSGYDPEAYPPHGYAAVESTGWTLYQQGKAQASATPPAPSSEPSKPAAPAAGTGEAKPDAAKTKTK